VQAVLGDFRTAAIPDKEKALFAFLEQVTRQSNQVTAADVRAVVDAGWTEEAVYDAITVCALFQFYNTWIDATGVGDMPPELYELSGQRLAAHGYLPGA
jgi:alkylhydroperoxidase family enzyme